MTDDSGPGAAGLNRRQLLKRGAAVGGTLVWAVPALEVISMTSAHASSPSGGGSQNQQGQNQNGQGQNQQGGGQQ